MKKQLLATLLASTVVMTACGHDKETTNKTDHTNKVTNTTSLIKAAKAAAKNVNSYASTYKNNINDGSNQSVIDFGLMIDEQHNQKVTIKDNKESTVFYVYDKKTVLKQNNQWIDASTYVGSQMVSQTEPLLYNSQFKLIDQLKGAKYEKNNGYTLTETFSDYKKYKALFGNTTENRKAINALEKKYPGIQGSIIVMFNKDKQIEDITNKLTLTNDNTTVSNNAVTTFDKINELKKLDIPDAVKQAESIQ
ncbi:hypothetical protein [Macrococcus equipercicus]|uniref:Lipoprotein n=1 Tax=Macrococcus equipercicus TaxID=69967 RepID=A0A9Q9F2W2_9STAP|nr:hypothetical protein [Macrococcus equipercicus]UTH13244.1 hypothetical protein KFV11_08210 [Macrococcus equipercicus]